MSFSQSAFDGSVSVREDEDRGGENTQQISKSPDLDRRAVCQCFNGPVLASQPSAAVVRAARQCEGPTRGQVGTLTLPTMSGRIDTAGVRTGPKAHTRYACLSSGAGGSDVERHCSSLQTGLGHWRPLSHGSGASCTLAEKSSSDWTSFQAEAHPPR